jgi:hypothetical protein
MKEGWTKALGQLALGIDHNQLVIARIDRAVRIAPKPGD